MKAARRCLDTICEALLEKASYVAKDVVMSLNYIRVRDHGPLVIEGEIPILDAEGNRFQCGNRKSKVALCRCGQTSQRPFCDGRHREIAFSAEERAATSD